MQNCETHLNNTLGVEWILKPTDRMHVFVLSLKKLKERFEIQNSPKAYGINQKWCGILGKNDFEKK